MTEVAALFVATGGVYFGLPQVDAWDATRDARGYGGPHPVVAHPPCARWGRYWSAGGAKLGDDDGCFASALASVRKWGGVLEHPHGSHAWRHHELNIPPVNGGWVNADFYGGWTCCIDQGLYGFRGRKRTWLYAFGVLPPPLNWGRFKTDLPNKRARRTGLVQRLSKRQRRATPVEFRDLLLSIARGADDRDS